VIAKGTKAFLAVPLFNPPNRIAPNPEPLGDIRLPDPFGSKQENPRSASDPVLCLAGAKVGLQHFEVFGLEYEFRGVTSHVPLLSL